VVKSLAFIVAYVISSTDKVILVYNHTNPLTLPQTSEIIDLIRYFLTAQEIDLGNYSPACSGLLYSGVILTGVILSHFTLNLE
jgi:hypothetical protein